MSSDSNSSGGCSGCLFAVVFLVVIVGLFGSCSGSPHSRYSGSYDRGNRSTTAEGEAQHYHYDMNGHIYDDKD